MIKTKANHNRRIFFLLLATIMLFCLSMAITPVALADAVTDAETIADQINAYDWGLSSDVTAVANGAIVTVTGDALSTPAGKYTITMFPDVTVIWQANITGAGQSGWGLLDITGTGGDFIIDGASIITDQGYALRTNSYDYDYGPDTLTITNGSYLEGKVQSTIAVGNKNTGFVLVEDSTLKYSGALGYMLAVSNSSSPSTSTMLQIDNSILVTSSVGSRALINLGTSVDIEINNSTLRATGADTPLITGGQTITINSGFLEAAGGKSTGFYGGQVINNNNDDTVININGGVLSAPARDSYVLNINEKSSLTVNFNGGALYTKEFDTIASGAPYYHPIIRRNDYMDFVDDYTGDGVVIVLAGSETGPFAKGSSTGLSIYPDDATAVWDVQDGEAGISYKNGANEGFFPVPEIVSLSANAGLLKVAGQTITAGSEVGTSAVPKTASITVANSVSSVTNANLTTATNATAALYSDSTFTTPQSPVNLNVGTNELYVIVTAEDGVTKLYYDVTITRQKSDDASLLKVAGETITAGSEAGTISTPITASISVANNVSSITNTDLTPATDATAVLYSDDTFTVPQSPVNLNVGANELYVIVTAEDGVTELYYDVTITRQKSDDASLLTVSAQTITAGSEAGTTSAPITASISVANNVSSIANADLATATDATAMLYSDDVFATAQSPVNLNVGANHLYVKVTAEDGITELYYDVMVTRQGSNDASLLSVAEQMIAVGSETGTISAPKTASITVASNVNSVANTDLTIADNAEAALFSDNAFVTMQSPISLKVGANHLYIKVTAEDGVTEIYYDVTASRQAGSSIRIDDNNDGKTDLPEDSPSTSTTTIGNATVTTPAGQEPIENEDGSYTLPGGGTITSGNLSITAPPETTITPEGTITFPADNSGAITYGNSFTFNLPPETVIILDEMKPLGCYISANNPFKDINTTDWFYNDMMFAYVHALMLGTSKDEFSPNMPLTRGMVVTVLYRMTGSPIIEESSFSEENKEENSGLFIDVPENEYYTDAVKWAAANGIVFGYGGGLFGPNDNITREQLAAIIYRFQQFSGKIPPNTLPGKEFADENKINDYAKEPVKNMVMQGILNGYPDGSFIPQGNATRAEFAAMLYRFLEALQ